VCGVCVVCVCCVCVRCVCCVCVCVFGWCVLCGVCVGGVMCVCALLRIVKLEKLTLGVYRLKRNPSFI